MTMALEILTENRFLGVRVSRTALAQLWSQYKPVSVFFYLFAVQRYARPSPLVSEHFGEHLLHIIDSREDLGCFVSTYMAARVRLQDRHYIDLPELRLAAAGGLPVPDLSVDPLCPEIRRAVLTYGKRLFKKNALRLKAL